MQAIDLVSDGLYFIAKDPDTGYWVYADTVVRQVSPLPSLVPVAVAGVGVEVGFALAIASLVEQKTPQAGYRHPVLKPHLELQ